MDFTQLASREAQLKTVAALAERNIQAELIETKGDALAKIKELIPQGASVMNGASRTLEEIGYIDLLKTGGHGWNNLHDVILAEKDPAKQAQLRKESVLSDFYLGSVHALAQTGEMVIASNTGSQLPHLVFTSPNLVLVVGAQKITPTLTDGLTRLDEHVIPLEDARMMAAYKMGTQKSKTLIFHRENKMMGRIVKVLIVNEKLGF